MKVVLQFVVVKFSSHAQHLQSLLLDQIDELTSHLQKTRIEALRLEFTSGLKVWVQTWVQPCQLVGPLAETVPQGHRCDTRGKPSRFQVQIPC